MLKPPIGNLKNHKCSQIYRKLTWCKGDEGFKHEIFLPEVLTF